MIKRSFIFLLCLSGCMYAQKREFSLEIGTGMGAGWWVYDKGLTDTLPSIHRGYDRTHLAAMWPSEFTGIYTNKRWSVGLGIGYLFLDDKRMIGSEHRRGRSRKYNVAAKDRKGITIRHVHLQGRYFLIENDRLGLGMQVRVGLFQMIHAHPRASTFRLHLSQEVGLIHLIPLTSHFTFYIRPQFSNFRIWTAEGFEGERHNVYSLSGVVGLRVALHSSSSSSP